MTRHELLELMDELETLVAKLKKALAPPVEAARPRLGRPSDPRWRGPDGMFNMTAYQREYQRKRRAAERAAKAGGSA
jgi:hypothetical protein